MHARLLTRLAGLAATLALALAAGAADDKPAKGDAPSKADLAANKAALQKLGDLVGEWKGSGSAKAGGKEAIWKETLSLGWKFEKSGETYLALEVKDGKFLNTGKLVYLPAKKVYQLTLTDAAKAETAYEGTIAKGGNLVLSGKDEKSGDVKKLTLYTLADGARMVVKAETQAKGKGLFSEQFSVAANKEGESFAGAAGKKNECCVTGGLGTIAVSYNGKAYYVCCSGCRDEFNDNPKKYADAFDAKKK